MLEFKYLGRTLTDSDDNWFGSSGKFEEGAGAVGTDVADFRSGGSRTPDGRELLQGVVASKTLVWR